MKGKDVKTRETQIFGTKSLPPVKVVSCDHLQVILQDTDETEEPEEHGFLGWIYLFSYITVEFNRG